MKILWLIVGLFSMVCTWTAMLKCSAGGMLLGMLATAFSSIMYGEEKKRTAV